LAIWRARSFLLQFATFRLQPKARATDYGLQATVGMRPQRGPALLRQPVL